MTFKPDYATPELVPTPLALYRVALVCGAAPLVSGLGILLLFWLTRWDPLPIAGLWLLFLGPVLILAGIVCLHSYLHVARKHGDAPQILKKRRTRAHLLFLANFLAAIFCFMTGIYLAEQIHVPITVRNKSAAPVTNLVLTTPSGTIKIDLIPPNSLVKRETRGENGGQVSCAATWKGKQHNLLVRDWIDADDAGSDEVLIDFKESGIIYDQ